MSIDRVPWDAAVKSRSFFSALKRAPDFFLRFASGVCRGVSDAVSAAPSRGGGGSSGSTLSAPPRWLPRAGAVTGAGGAGMLLPGDDCWADTGPVAGAGFLEKSQGWPVNLSNKSPITGKAIVVGSSGRGAYCIVKLSEL